MHQVNRGNGRGVTRVLIAVDETEASVHAADAAYRLFGRDAEYLAVSVIDASLYPDPPLEWDAAWGSRYPVPYGSVWPLAGILEGRGESGGGASPADVAQRAAEDTARRAVEHSDLAAAEPVGDIGDPADVILRTATERSADVIVVGSHHRGWFDRLLHHSVGADVVKHSPIPVLVVSATQ
jgi:nucleotide-binding universal stress UspA family protein